MPVKPSRASEKSEAVCMESCCTSRPSLFNSSFGAKIIATLLAILLVYGVVYLGTLIRNNMEKFYYIGKADKPERTLSVDAQGKVSVRPDIAVTTMGMVAEAPTVAEAQKKNTEVMNKLVESLKALGIEAKDIQTVNYNVYPQYNYTERDGQTLKGYQVNQSVSVKIRNLDNANKVLALAGEVGANNVSGLSFTIDDRENYKAQAREQALKKIQEKAVALSRSLGVNVVGVVSYNEYEGTGSPEYGGPVKEMSLGAGGAGAPSVEPGNTEVTLNVSVTYEIR